MRNLLKAFMVALAMLCATPLAVSQDAAGDVELVFTLSDGAKIVGKEVDTYLDFIIRNVYGSKTFEEALVKKTALISKNRAASRCAFNPTTNREELEGGSSVRLFDRCSLRQTNNQNSLGISRPATFTYTLNNDDRDSFAIAAAFLGSRTFGPGAISLNTEWQRNTLISSQQDNLTIGLGYNFELFRGANIVKREKPRLERATQVGAQNGLRRELNQLPEKEKPTLTGADVLSMAESQVLNELDRSSYSFTSFYFVNNISYNRRGLFPNLQAQACVDNPVLPACSRQNIETLRITTQVVPYSYLLEAQAPPNSSLPYWRISPNVGLFYDEALNEGVELLTGEAVDGGVVGLSTGVTLSVVPIRDPKNTLSRLSFTARAQLNQTFARDRGRQATFERSSELFSIAAEWALYDTETAEKADKAKSAFFKPTFGITYINGSDSLLGRASQDTIVFALGAQF